jgi:hypothetical protein
MKMLYIDNMNSRHAHNLKNDHVEFDKL